MKPTWMFWCMTSPRAGSRAWRAASCPVLPGGHPALPPLPLLLRPLDRVPLGSGCRWQSCGIKVSGPFATGVLCVPWPLLAHPVLSVPGPVLGRSRGPISLSLHLRQEAAHTESQFKFCFSGLKV